jgi:hypothetical protein
VGAITQVPTAILPCVVAGAIVGSGANPSLNRLRLAVDVTNATQAAVGLGLALSSGGLSGFLSAACTKGLVGGLTVAMVSRGGASRMLAEKVLASHPESDSAPLGVARGILSGLKIGVLDGARVGWAQGRGYVAGIYDAAAGIRATAPSTPVASTPRGTVLATVNAPIGLAQCLIDALSSSRTWTPTAQVAATAALGAGVATAATMACIGGAVPAVIGGLTGATLGLGAAALSRPTEHVTAVRQMLDRVMSANPPLGDSVVERNRDFICAAIVGPVAAWRTSRAIAAPAVPGQSPC